MLTHNMLFRTNESGQIEDERLFLFDEFKAVVKTLSINYMLYIMLTQDYESPLWLQPQIKKQLLAKKKCFNDGEYEFSEKELSKIVAAKILYDEIQYDPLVAQYESQKNLHDMATKELINLSGIGSSKQDIDRLATTSKVQKDAENEMDRLKEKIRKRQETTGKVQGDKVISYYQIWLESKKKLEIKANARS
jgi:hypothetical protein